MPTLYEVLDVDRDADRARIQAAFRDRVKAVHPDHSDDPDARDEFQRVYTAQEVLADPAERERYDAMGHAAYIRRHGDPDLWELPGGEGSGPSSADPDRASAGPADQQSSRDARDRSATGPGSTGDGPTAHGSTGDGSTGPGSTGGQSPGERARASSGSRAYRRESVVDGDVAWVAGEGTWTARQSVPQSPAAGRRADLQRLLGSTQSLVIAGALLVFYPLVAYGAISPRLPLPLNLIVAVCLVVIVAYLVTIPEFGLTVFLGWGIVGGIALLVGGASLPLAVGYLLVTWVPAGLAGLTMLAIRY